MPDNFTLMNVHDAKIPFSYNVLSHQCVFLARELGCLEDFHRLPRGSLMTQAKLLTERVDYLCEQAKKKDWLLGDVLNWRRFGMLQEFIIFSFHYSLIRMPRWYLTTADTLVK